MTTQQTYLADAAIAKADELMKAFQQLPEDKRDWSPGGDARTALNLLAECVILADYTADTIEKHAMDASHMTNYEADTAAVMALPMDELAVKLTQNVQKVAETIRAVPDSDMDVSVEMPWRPMTVSQLITYPYWNLSYHEGQINYIASILGCLK